jgi:hypothetical protein
MLIPSTTKYIKVPDLENLSLMSIAYNCLRAFI